MKLLKILAISFGLGFLLLGTTGHAHADEFRLGLQEDENDDLKLRHFSGFYAGIGYGYTDYDDWDGGGGSTMFFGYKHQFRNNLILGVEVFSTGPDANVTDEVREEFPADFPSFIWSNVPTSAAGVMAKLGYAPSDKFMFYGGIGWTNRLDGGFEINPFDIIVDGAMAELGAEWKLKKWLGVRVSAQRSIGLDAFGFRRSGDATSGLVSVVFSF